MLDNLPPNIIGYSNVLLVFPGRIKPVPLGVPERIYLSTRMSSQDRWLNLNFSEAVFPASLMEGRPDIDMRSRLDGTSQKWVRQVLPRFKMTCTVILTNRRFGVLEVDGLSIFDTTQTGKLTSFFCPVSIKLTEAGGVMLDDPKVKSQPSVGVLHSSLMEKVRTGRLDEDFERSLDDLSDEDLDGFIELLGRKRI